MYKLVINICFLLLCMTLSACATQLRTAVPASLIDKANVAHFQGIRFWGDQDIPNLQQGAAIRRKQIMNTRPEILKDHINKKVYLLALSGGGSDGAFGAGFLNGWSKTGNRPKFEVVTGVSTGALIAPFAFLGSKYDEQLKEIYTSYSTKDILTKNYIAGLIGSKDALTSSQPMLNLISNYIDQDFLASIAKEHLSGRRLLIGTTNLDTERSVVWDMGQIATDGTPKALDLFRKIMLASTSLPGVFPPVYIKVNANNQIYKEMHVDGGVTDNAFLFPSQFDINKVEKNHTLGKVRLYVINNNKTHIAPQEVKANIYDIADRSISSLIRQQNEGDLLRLYLNAKKNKIDFNMVSIPDNFSAENNEAFDKNYMKILYSEGYKIGIQDYKWQKKPPGS